MKTKRSTAAIVGVSVALVAAMGLVGCGQQLSSNENTAEQTASVTTVASGLDLSGQKLNDSDITIKETYENSANGEHAITADNTTAQYTNAAINKTGDSEGDDADFYGTNASTFATNGATLNLADTITTTNGKHANGIFSYGTGTTVNVSHSIIRTTADNSGGLMTTGGGTTNADDVTAETTGNSSAAIRSDRGGGTVNVNGGYYATSGTGSPVIYSTADITCDTTYLESTSSQGVVVEGKNSVTLKGSQLIANNISKNSDKSDYYQAVMIYQSMSGDATSGKSSFTMENSSLTNKNGDIFFINNTACDINLTSSYIENDDANGVFLRAAAAGWGNSGSNGGKVNLNASSQGIDGNMLVDDVSTLNLYLKDGSVFTGAVNPDGQAGSVYVEVAEGSAWVLTADSYVSSLTCAKGTIKLNGHKLYVNGTEYDGSSESTGTACEIATEGSSNGQPGDMPSGQPGSTPDSSQNPPAKPDGDNTNMAAPSGQGGEPGAQGGNTTPPAKPDGDNTNVPTGQGGDPGAQNGNTTPPAKPSN